MYERIVYIYELPYGAYVYELLMENMRLSPGRAGLSFCLSMEVLYTYVCIYVCIETARTYMAQLWSYYVVRTDRDGERSKSCFSKVRLLKLSS